MAGMAWTLHPALFYEKYGTVLVQLWESGDVGTLFNPVRRLSRSIGDRITSLRRPQGTTATAAPKAGAVGGAAEAPGLTDDGSAATEDVTEDVTEDDAMSRVNREPGDTSSEPSTSQQNELAFQGDIYTQMRRNRRQRERLQKIRETREKFLEGRSTSSAGSEFGRKRRGFQRHGSSILVSKKDKGFKKAAGGGTPLTDMEGVVPVRAVMIDVSGSPGGSSSSEDEDVADKFGEKPGATIQADELLEENDSLQAFRDVRGTSKRGHRSPPPTVRAPSESQTDTESIASISAAGQAPVASTPPLKKLAQPFVAAKPPGHSALRKHKASSRIGPVALRGKLVTEPERCPSVASIDTPSAAVPGTAGPSTEANLSSATSLLSTKELVSNDKGPESPSQVKSVAKKDSSKRRKRKVEKERKKAKDKSKATVGSAKTSRALSADSGTAGDLDSGAISEDAKPRRKPKTAKSPSKASTRSPGPGSDFASRESPTSTSETTSSQVPEAVRNKDGAKAVSMSATSVSTPDKLADEDSTLPSVVGKATQLATDIAMVHSKLPGGARAKGEHAVKTAPSPRGETEQRTTSQREERVAEGKASASTQAEAAPSSEALGTSDAASRRATGVHKRRGKKQRTSKSPAGADVDTPSGAPLTSTKDVELKTPHPASTDSEERVFDKAGAIHDHHRHHRRRHSKSKKHAKEVDGKRRSRKNKEDRPVDVTALATGGVATTTEVGADGGPTKIEGSDAATTALKESSVPSQPVQPPTADGTLSGSDTLLSLGGQRRPPRTNTVVRGDDVTVQVDMSSRNRMAMFWPFSHKGQKKKQTKGP
ncbi:hypothetical protein MTO96_027383 [Rhipicephalus appendiculatus]